MPRLWLLLRPTSCIHAVVAPSGFPCVWPNDSHGTRMGKVHSVNTKLTRFSHMHGEFEQLFPHVLVCEF
jgi:hypothetical protein